MIMEGSHVCIDLKQELGLLIPVVPILMGF